MEEEDGLRTTYAYDAAYRLTGVDGRSGKLIYSYDAAGNRLEETQ